MPRPTVPTMATAKIAIATVASVDIGRLRLVVAEVRVAARRQPDRQRAEDHAHERPYEEERQPEDHRVDAVGERQREHEEQERDGEPQQAAAAVEVLGHPSSMRSAMIRASPFVPSTRSSTAMCSSAMWLSPVCPGP